MALTLPDGWKAMLENGGRIVPVFEIEPAAGNLYYSSQAVTWGGQDYTALALRHSKIVNDIGARVSEVSVTFSNVSGTLRDQLEPVDLLTGRRFTLRLLIRNDSGDLDAGSIVPHVGTIEKPVRSNETTVVLTSIGLTMGVLGLVAPRSTSIICNVQKFGDIVQGDCNSTATSLGVTTTSGGTGNIIPVTSVTPFADDLARDPTGTSTISIGTNTGLILTAAAGGNLTVSGAAITWLNLDDVSFDLCDRTHKACQARARTFEFQGFRGIDSLEDDLNATQKIRALERLLLLEELNKAQETNLTHSEDYYDTGPYNPNNTAYLNSYRSGLGTLGAVINDRRRAVPIIYGRREVPGLKVEHLVQDYDTGTSKPHEDEVAVLSEGVISEVVAWYSDGTRQIQGDDQQQGLTEKKYKAYGIFYRAGGVGLDADELIGDYDGGTLGSGDSVTWPRDQNRDYYSNAKDPLSRTAYVTLVKLRAISPTEIGIDSRSGDVTYEVKGVVVWRYTNASVATHDPADGPARVWSRNPIWQVVDLMTSDRYGLGKIIEESDIDFTVIKGEADYCDVVIDGQTVTVDATPLGSTNFIYNVDDTDSFERGMAVEYDGPLHPTESDTIVDVISTTQLLLGTARADAASGDTITSKTPRYTSDTTIDATVTAHSAIAGILASCQGYITFSADGKIQVRCEREESLSSTSSYSDTDPDNGYGVTDFKWLVDTTGLSQRVNRVHVSYLTQKNESREVTSTDFPHSEAAVLNPSAVSIRAVDNVEVATRIADLRLNKHKVLGTTASIKVGTIGLQHNPGDRIALTHTVPGWTDKDMRITRTEVFGLGSNSEFMVVMTLEGYDASVYSNTDKSKPNDSVITTSPAITLTVDSAVQSVRLSWIDDGLGTAQGKYGVYRSSSSMAGDPRPWHLVARLHGSDNTYNYSVAEDEFDTTLYFIVKLQLPGGGGWYQSNEITAVPIKADPVDTQFEPGINTFAGGDFNDAIFWDEDTPSSTPVKPDSVTNPSAGFADPWTDPGDAYDDIADSFATSSLTVLGDNRACTWHFPTAVDVAGRLRVRAKLDQGSGAKAWRNQCHWKYSIDGGTNFSVWTEEVPSKIVTDKVSPVLTLSDRANLAVRILHFKAQTAAGTTIGSVDEIFWDEDSAAGAAATVSGDRGNITGDDASDKGTLAAPWPGQIGESTQAIPVDREFVVHLQAESTSTPSKDVEVVLYHVDNDTEYPLLTIAKADILSTPRSFCAKFKAPVAMQGQFEIYVRTAALGWVVVDKLQINEGVLVWAFARHKSESQEPDSKPGKRTGYTPAGAWAAITGATQDVQYRISEVVPE